MTGELLYEIVRYMSSAEKNYFTSIAKQKTKKESHLYYKLFKALDKMKNYDASALEKVIPKHQLAYQKNYLHQLLTITLVRYNLDNGIDETLATYIASIRYFIKKKLWTNAKHYLKKSIKLVESESDYINQNYQYQIYELALSVEQALPTYEKFDDQIEYLEKLYNKIKLITHGLEELHHLQFVEGWYSIANKKGVFKEQLEDDILDKSQQLIEETINQPLKTEHFNNRDIFLGLNGVYQNYIKPKSKTATDKNYYKERLALYNEFPIYIQEHPKDYTSLVSNILQTAILSKDLNGFDELILLLKRIFENNDEPSKELKFEAMRVYVVNVLIQTCLSDNVSVKDKIQEYQTIVPFLERVEALWSKFKREDIYLAYIYYFAILLTFQTGQYKTSINYVQQFLKYYLSSQHKQYILLLRILMHYEIEELETAWALLRSFKRKFSRIMNNKDKVLFLIVETIVQPKAKMGKNIDQYNDALDKVANPLIKKVFRGYLSSLS